MEFLSFGETLSSPFLDLFPLSIKHFNIPFSSLFAFFKTMYSFVKGERVPTLNSSWKLLSVVSFKMNEKIWEKKFDELVFFRSWLFPKDHSLCSKEIVKGVIVSRKLFEKKKEIPSVMSGVPWLVFLYRSLCSY